MKTKDGCELDVLGQVQIVDKIHFIVKLPYTIYQDNRLVRYILLPITDFKIEDGVPDVEYVKMEMKNEQTL